VEVFAKTLNPSENFVPECDSVAGVEFPGFIACIVLDAGRSREFKNLPGQPQTALDVFSYSRGELRVQIFLWEKLRGASWSLLFPEARPVEGLRFVPVGP
jgi:hypothetical protein